MQQAAMDAVGQAAELTDEELEMIKRSLVVVIPHRYIEKLLTSVCCAKADYYPTRSLEPVNDLAQSASQSHVIVIELDVEPLSPLTQSSDELYGPKRSGVANGNAGLVLRCRENRQTAPTKTAGPVTMASENLGLNMPALCNESGFPVIKPSPGKNVEDPDENTPAWCNEVTKNGYPVLGKNVESSDLSMLRKETANNVVLEHNSTPNNVYMDDVSTCTKATLPESTASSNVCSQQRIILNNCKSPVELYMAAVPTFLKSDPHGSSLSTCKSESLFSPSQLETIRLKAEPGGVSALFPTFQRARSRSGRSRRKLFDHRQLLTIGDKCSGSSSPSAVSLMSSDSDSRCDLLEDCTDSALIPARNPEALFQRPHIQPRSLNRKKRKLYNSDKRLCPLADDLIVPEPLSGTTASPFRVGTTCSLHSMGNRLPKTHGTGEEVLSSTGVLVGKLYSETLTLLRKRSLDRLECVTNRASAESSEKARTDGQEMTKLDVVTAKSLKTRLVDSETKPDEIAQSLKSKPVDGETKLKVAAESSPVKRLVDDTIAQVASVLPVESNTVNGARIQALLNTNGLSIEQQKALNNRLFDDKLKRFTFSHFRSFYS